MGGDRRIFTEDFSGLAVGLFPTDQTPVGEYHCMVPPGRRGRWTELTVHHRWRRELGWWVGERDGVHFLEHAAHRVPFEADADPVTMWGIPSLLATGDAHLDLRLEAEVEPVGTVGAAGLAFRLVSARHFLALVLEPQGGAVLVRIVEDRTEVLGRCAADPAAGRRRLQVEADGPVLRARLDDGPEVTVRDAQPQAGRIGLVAWGPLRYHHLAATCRPAQARARRLAGKASAEAVAQAQAALPKPVLWRRCDLGAGGAGHSVRFGDLDGDGELEILMVQCVQRQGHDNLAAISCLTAYKLDGRVLWQRGVPDPRHAVVTADLPVQIHDLDGDGRTEVVLSKDYHLEVLAGATGRTLRSVPTPPMRRDGEPRPREALFARLSGDALAFADLDGCGRARDLLIKDRYDTLWALDGDLAVRWMHPGKTGHYPFIADLDGDGRDEVLIGSTLLGPDGAVRWHLPTRDHVDTAAVARLDPQGAPVVMLACSDDGLYLLDLAGRPLAHHRIGHAQDLAIGRFRDDLPGLQFFTKTFWGHPGIISLFDATLERRLVHQGYPLGSQVYPIDWAGDGRERILLSAHLRLGGLLDGWGRRLPLLPADGHPWLCCRPLDVTGDGRDEILCWDQRRLWIYTQDRAPADPRWRPSCRLPHRNESNYRCEISLPAGPKAV
jgi:hypothetical protein